MDLKGVQDRLKLLREVSEDLNQRYLSLSMEIDSLRRQKDYYEDLSRKLMADLEIRDERYVYEKREV